MPKLKIGRCGHPLTVWFCHKCGAKFVPVRSECCLQEAASIYNGLPVTVNVPDTNVTCPQCGCNYCICVDTNPEEGKEE